MLGYRFHPLAERELDEAVNHYEGLAPGKGLELALQVQSAISRVREFPDSAPVSRGKVRSVIVPGWEYTVHYRVKSTHIRILAVAHQARQPFYWLGRR